MKILTVEKFLTASRAVRSLARARSFRTVGYEQDIWKNLDKLANAAATFFGRLRKHHINTVFKQKRNNAAFEFINDLIGDRLTFTKSYYNIRPKDFDEVSFGLMEAVLEYNRFCLMSFPTSRADSTVYIGKYYDINDVLKGGWK